MRKNIIAYAVLAMLFFLIIANTDKSIIAVHDALTLVSQTVIPSLFPFFVLSSLMINTGFVTSLGKLISPLARLIFRTSGNGAVVFVMGVLCGYPTGAKMASELYKNNMIEREEAERLLPFCNNSGPLFVIGAVGGMLGNVSMGVSLYIIHVLSAFLTGVALSMFSRRKAEKKCAHIISVNLGKAVSDSVVSGTQTMLNVCGFITFFSVINSFLTPLILKLTGKNIAGFFLSGLTEVTLGAENIILKNLNSETTFVLLSGILGFGGVCVLLQVMGIVTETNLSIKKYVLGKSLQMTISMLLSKLYVLGFNAQPVFLSVGEITKRYTDAAPVILLSFLIALVYFAARKN